MALGAGSIGFVGFNADGKDNLAFVALEGIPAGTVVTFTDNAWTGTAFATGESTWTWTAGSDIAAGSVVTMDNLAAGETATSNTGAIAYTEEGTRGFDGNVTEVVYAYIGDASAPTFLTAISNGGTYTSVSGVLNGTGLEVGNGFNNGTAVDFGATPNVDIAAYNGPRVGSADFENLRTYLFNSQYWVSQDTAGDDSAGTAPDTPFDTTPFNVDTNAQKVSFSADSMTISQSEGNGGTTTFTFVVERTGSTVGDVHFSGFFSQDLTDAADYAGGILPSDTFSGTIPAGQTSTTVTITINGDTTYEPDEHFSFFLAEATNSSATAYVSPNWAQEPATGTIVNDDTQQVIGFTADSVNRIVSEGDDGTTTVTFTVERTGGTTGDVSFSGLFLNSGTNAADYDGAMPGANFSGVIPDGQSSVTFTITFKGDTTAEAHEGFGFWLRSVSNSAGQSVVLVQGAAQQAKVEILNDDGPSVVHAGETVNSIGLTGETSLTIAQGGSVNIIEVKGVDFDVTVDNAGTFSGNLQGSGSGNGKITLNNAVTGTITNGMIVPQYQGADSLEFVFNNAGISGVVRAHQNTTYEHITINNLAGGIIANGGTNATAVDLRGNATINNSGKIISANTGDPREGIEARGDNVVVNNLTGGWIEGTHHAVTSNSEIRVVNEAGGTMIGRNGSAVNIDNSFANGEVVTVINRGLMQGQASSTFDGDGDAIDTDATAVIENWGTIEGLNHGGSHNGGWNVSEGIAIGGGRITNHEGGLIAGYGRGIQVDDSAENSAFTEVVITNAGTIRGYGNLPKYYPMGEGSEPVGTDYRPDLIYGAEAISIVGTHADTLTNSATGKIIGGVRMGGGNDTVSNDGSMEALYGSAVDLGEGDDLFVNRGTVDGDVLAGAGNDEIINVSTGKILGDVVMGDGNDKLGQSGLITSDIDTGEGDDFVNLYVGAQIGGIVLLGAGNDFLSATASGDIVVDAGDDDDTVAMGDGDDEVYGGAGNDMLYGGGGDDLIEGGEGDDYIQGNDGDDTLAGGDGNDILLGGAGDDELDGGEGVDTADYGFDTAGITVDLAEGTASGEDAGEDELIDIENVIGGSGNDTFTGSDANNVFTGGAGKDTLVLSAATGAIALDLSAGAVSAEGLGTDSFTLIEAFQLGEGDDIVTITGGAVAVAIHGGAGDDTLVLTGNGTLGDLSDIEKIEVEGDWTLTDEGFDIALKDGAQTLTLGAAQLTDGSFTGTISGLTEEDRIELSGLAATSVTLGEGNLLTLAGPNGPVTLQLDPAADFSGMAFTVVPNGTGGSYLSFGPANGGDDVFTGGNGDDVFDGGAGNDTIKGGAGDDQLSGGSGDDTIDGGSGDDTIDGGIGNDVIKAGSGDDVIEGGEGDDVIDAGSGDDIVNGGAGNDVIDGGSGDDRILGGAGDDVLLGGSGHDAFVFAAGFGHDTITDFKTTGSSADVLEFDTDIFADFASALAAADQVGKNVVFTFDADHTITLENVQLSSLAADDFHFV